MPKTKQDSPFFKKVYRLVCQIPPGKVSTYGLLAHALNTRAYRAVGQALRRSPGMPTVPCHRVIKSNGHVGGFNGALSGRKIRQKIKLLQKEGVAFSGQKIKNFAKLLYHFD